MTRSTPQSETVTHLRSGGKSKSKMVLQREGALANLKRRNLIELETGRGCVMRVIVKLEANVKEQEPRIEVETGKKNTKEAKDVTETVKETETATEKGNVRRRGSGRELESALIGTEEGRG